MSAATPPPIPDAGWTALRAVAWVTLNLGGLAGGGVAGLALAPRANAHNDWGATGLLFIALGAVAGSSLVVAGLAVWAGGTRGVAAGPRAAADRGPGSGS